MKNKKGFQNPETLIITGGDDETRTRDLPADSAGRSNQGFDEIFAFTTLNLVFPPYCRRPIIELLIVHKFPWFLAFGVF